jgi:oxygen-independent coproporphyrinogen-3 oxidase
MAGIYIHIPFCKTKCHYCDFYKSTDFASRPDFLSALKLEIGARKDELQGEIIESIYFGGGTPSVLKVEEIKQLLDQLFRTFTVSDSAEITMECNPDDLSADFLKALKATVVNRLSIGTQSFNQEDLKSMNRRHNGKQAVLAVQLARETGFSNISIDLIYGLPNQTLEAWLENVQQAVQLGIQHISAYHLTYHEGTVFFDYLKTGKIKELPDELSFNQFKILKQELEQAGFEHYEISNFSLPGLYSRHNWAYWERKSYLGFGPSAHSFDLKTRRWNVSSLRKYLQAFENNSPYWETELLSEQDQYNDYVITSLRTQWGILDAYLKNTFNRQFYKHFQVEIEPFIRSGYVRSGEGAFRLTTEGLFISDKIMEQLLYVED